MEKNGINIINDLDKENDDLMTHLGILQQFSLGEKTNVLKNIKSYEDDFLENSNINNTNENNIFKKSDVKEKTNINNKKDLVSNPSGNEIDDKFDKKDLDINIIKQEKINNKYNINEENKNEEMNDLEDKNEINDIYKIFKNKEKLIPNLNNKKLLNQDENNNKNESEIIINNNVKSNNLKINEEKNDFEIDSNIKNEKLNILEDEDDLFNKDFEFKKDNYESLLDNENLKP